jgi:hypothetical protein
MQTAEEVLSKTYVSFMKNWGLIQSLRHVAEIALPIAKEQLAQQNTALVDSMSKDPDFKKIVVMKDGTEAEWSKEVKMFFGTGMTDTSIGNFTAAIDAASIVFAQSILDDCALSFLRVCAIAAPADWDPYVNDRRVDFNTIKAKNPDTIREGLVIAKIEQLGMESLKKKIDLLFALTQPPRDFDPLKNYKYDPDRIEKIDRVRQSIIHRDGMGKPLTDVEENLEYVMKTVSFLLALVNMKYGVKIDPKIMFPNVAKVQEQCG